MMKKFYLLSVPFMLLLFTGCSKDFLKNYEDRLEGAGRVDHRGKDGHRRRIGWEAVEMVAHVLVDQFMLDEQPAEVIKLRGRR